MGMQGLPQPQKGKGSRSPRRGRFFQQGLEQRMVKGAGIFPGALPGIGQKPAPGREMGPQAHLFPGHHHVQRFFSGKGQLTGAAQQAAKLADLRAVPGRKVEHGLFQVLRTAKQRQHGLPLAQGKGESRPGFSWTHFLPQSAYSLPKGAHFAPGSGAGKPAGAGIQAKTPPGPPGTQPAGLSVFFIDFYGKAVFCSQHAGT